MGRQFRIVSNGKKFLVQSTHGFIWVTNTTASGVYEFITKEEAEAFIAARKAGLPDHNWHVCE